MPKKQARKAAQPAKTKKTAQTQAKPPTRQNGRKRPEKPIPAEPITDPEVPSDTVASTALPETLPIFMRWTVTKRTAESRSTGKTTHHASLCFDGDKVYTLEGPDAGDKLQHQADQWNAQEYIPKLDVHPGYFRSRPGVEAFLERGRGDKPFAT